MPQGVNCPVHGPGYGRCLGCLLEACYGIRHIENEPPIIIRHGDLWAKTKAA